MDKTPLVSIVMPMYNQEKYIEECLLSVINQTLKDIEIIVVNDGSTDRSLDIVSNFAKKDKRIKIVDKKNSGYGHSMNMGMAVATGKYIGIVETDDYVDKNMFHDLYKIAKGYNADIVKSDYYEFSSNLCKKEEYIKTPINDYYYNKILTPRKDENIFHFRMNTWTGIYKTDYLRLNCIRHNETPGASYQDNGFWFKTLALANRVVFCNKAYYHYRQDNPNSSINSKSKVFCMCDEYKFIREFLDNDSRLKEQLLHIFLIKKYYNYFYTYKRIARENRVMFLERFADEFNASYKNNEFNKTLLPTNEMSTLLRIMDNPKQFYYDDLIWDLTHSLNEKINNYSSLYQTIEDQHGKN